jgi:DNA-binding HxlR family transcriptional regulator
MPAEPSFHHFQVQHFCPVAQSLERVGDRWSWLIVRDLMRGPLRFTDLQRFLAGITPKRLTVNLRALEAEGIVAREHEEGRREVWYRLTEKGQGLVPVIKALALWGLEYTMHAPMPGETVFPDHVMGVLSTALNRRGLRLPHPVTWTVRFGPTSVFHLRFDGEQWTTEPTDVLEADVRIETIPATWAAFVLSSSQEERQRLLSAMRVRGEQARVDDLLAICSGTGRHERKAR